MKTRTVAYATQPPSPMTVMSGASHHRSVRSVFAAMAARARAPGLVAVVVILYVSLTAHPRGFGATRYAACRRPRAWESFVCQVGYVSPGPCVVVHYRSGAASRRTDPS